MSFRLFPVALALIGGVVAAGAHAQNPDPTDIRACTAIESDAQRLACYDHATGRANPLSRSWNRVTANIGFERDNWTVMLRPWWRIPEPRGSDDNPDISNYMGRGEVQIMHEWRGQEFSMLLRHSLRRGDRSHGAARFGWSFPLAGNLRGYAEAFHGYGESLIDYNRQATYLGIGLSLLDWY